MNDQKKPTTAKNGAYKSAAAARRTKLASAGAPGANEISPVNGKFQVALNGKPVSRANRSTVFGPSAIRIPEFSTVRKK